MTAVEVLLCIDVYLKKGLEEEEGKPMVLASRRKVNENPGNQIPPRDTKRSRLGGLRFHWVIHSPGLDYVANFHMSHSKKELTLDKDTRYSRADPKFISKPSVAENTGTILRNLRLNVINRADPQQWFIPAAPESSRVHTDYSFA